MTDVVYRIEPREPCCPLDWALYGQEVIKIREAEPGWWAVWPPACIEPTVAYVDKAQGMLVLPGQVHVAVPSSWLVPFDALVQTESDFGGLTVTEYA